jgi:uncharacterized protein
MIQPNEMCLELPMDIARGVSTTTKVWEMLAASRDGNLKKVKELVDECPGLLYAQYNYTPPIHFAVREGHTDLVKYLLAHGAYDPGYRTYPFQDSLLTIAQDRGYHDIALLLQQYACDPSLQQFKGDNGAIHFNRSPLQKEFENAVDKENIGKIKEQLQDHPGLALDETFFWGEGILMMPAKTNNRPLLELLMHYGAKVPGILKWTQFYYFERYDSAAFLMENGMSPNTMSWQHVTILHDMAQKGDMQKATLLIKRGADINAVDEEYQSTPLGMAARWGHREMVEFLLDQGADPGKSGATWAAPLVWAGKKGHIEIENILRNSRAC